MSSISLSGNWRSFYRYPSSGRDQEFWGRHLLHAAQAGNKVHLESGPDSPSHVEIDLTFDTEGRTAQGTWQERTNPAGYYEGVTYDGTIELEISDDGQRLSGAWQGKGKDGTMNSGVWELTKEDVAQPDQTQHLTEKE